MEIKISPHLSPVFESLKDEESRRIFLNMLSFSRGNGADFGNGLSQRLLLPNGQFLLTVSELIDNYAGQKIILYGAGICGVWAYHYLTAFHKMDVACFCDSSESIQGSEFQDLPVLSPEQLETMYKNSPIVISVTSDVARQEIYNRLAGLGFSSIYVITPAQIYHAPGIQSVPYFGLPFLEPVADEIYVDVGCYDGETLRGFVGFCGGEYKKIYAIEPDTVSFKKLSAYVRDNGFKDIELIQKGVWSSNTTLKFNNSGGFSSRVTGHGTCEIPVETIDRLVDVDVVTLIKIDIEGAELEALKGASAVIQKHRPRLAVSIYHSPMDIETLPLFIHKLLPEYGFYIRHHSQSFVDTVLYAV